MSAFQINKNEFFRIFTAKLCGSLDITKALLQCAAFLDSISFPFDGIIVDAISDDEPCTLNRIAGITRSGEIRGEGLVSKVDPETWKFQEAHLKSNKILLMNAPENRAYAESLYSYTYGVLDNSDMSMPIVFEGKPLGFMVFRAIGKNKYSQEHVELLDSVKESVAMAVANAINFERENKHNNINNISVELIFNRIKSLKKIKTNAELAVKLGGQASNIANWKLRNTIPYDKIINFCLSEQIPLDFIFMHAPFILNRKKDNKFIVVLDKNPKALLDASEVEELLKIPQDSLDAYLATCVRGLDIIPPPGTVPESCLQEFLRMVYGRHAGLPSPAEQVMVNVTDGTVMDDGSVVPTNSFICFRKKWFDRKGLSRKTFAYKMQGDSMYPTLLNEDIVLIDPAQVNAKAGGLYAVNLEGVVMVRRLLPADKAVTLLICDNKIYPTERYGDVSILGRVMWYGREI